MGLPEFGFLNQNQRVIFSLDDFQKDAELLEMQDLMENPTSQLHQKSDRPNIHEVDHRPYSNACAYKICYATCAATHHFQFNYRVFHQANYFRALLFRALISLLSFL